MAAAAGKKLVQPGNAAASFLSQKLHGAIDSGGGEGQRMPLVGGALSSIELDLVDAWINAGAPQAQEVPGAPCLPPATYTPAPALDPPPGGYQMVLNGPILQPGQEQEGCIWVPVPNATNFDVGKWEFSLNPGTHHFAIFEWSASGTPTTNVWRPGDIGCISGANFGNNISGSPQAPYYVDAYPTGVARRLVAGKYLGLNAHYYNTFTVPIQIKVYINIHPYSGPAPRLATTIVDIDDTLTIDVPPFTSQVHPPAANPRARWANTGSLPKNVIFLGGHMHNRGVRFTVWDATGQKMYESLDWAHPNVRVFSPALVLPPGGYFDYECLYDNNRPLRLELVPAHAARSRAGDRLHPPTPCLFALTTTGGEERAAPLVHRPVEQLAVGGVGPLVEQVLGNVPAAGPELQLADVEPLDRVRRRLAALLGRGEQRGQCPTCRLELAAPHEPLTGDPLGRLREIGGGRRGGSEPLAHVVDRPAAERPCPRERVERQPLDLRPGVAGRRERLERPRLGFLDTLDPDRGDVLGKRRQHRRARACVVPALDQGQLEIPLDVVVTTDLAAGEQDVRAGARDTGRDRLERGDEKVGDASLLAREHEVARQLEETFFASRVVRRREAQGVLCKLGSRLDGAARGGVRGGRRDRRRERRVWLARGEREVARAHLAGLGQTCESAMQLATLAGGRRADGRRCKERVRRPDALVVDDQRARRDRPLQRSRLSQPGELIGSHASAERHGEQQPAFTGREPRDARPEEVADLVRHGQLVAHGEGAFLGKLPADLECEERVSHRHAVDPPGELMRQREPQARSQHAAERAEGQRAELEAAEPARLESDLERGLFARPLREQEADVVSLESPRGIGERLGGRRIEPLQVVHGDDHGRRRGEGPQRVQETNADRARLGRRARWCRSEQRNLEGMPLRRGKLRQLVRLDSVEEVDQAREREARLCVARTRGEHAQPCLPGGHDPGFPEGGLANAGTTDEDERVGARRVGKLLDGCELAFPSNDTEALRVHLRHTLTSARPRAGSSLPWPWRQRC